MKTTVVILNFNGEQWLGKLLTLLDGENCKTIIVDNHSTDNSRKVFDDTKLRHSERMTWVQLSKNMGFARGNNVGASLVDTENILFLNNDTLPQRGFVAHMEKSRYPIVGAKLIFGENKKVPVKCDTGDFTFHATKGEVQHAGICYYEDGLPYEHGRSFRPDDGRVTKAGIIPSVTAACMLIKKAVFGELGGFSANYINGWEDSDLCLRAKEKGYLCWYEPLAQIIHFCSSSEGRFKHESKNRKLWEKTWIESGRIKGLV